MRPTCIAIDFDGTLAYFKGGYDQLFAIFTRRGVDNSIVRESYEQSKREGGFTITRLMKIVAERTSRSFDDEAINGEFADWLGRSLVPCAEAALVLTVWRDVGIPVVILTSGDMDYQAQKVHATRLPHDDLIVVAHEAGKIEALRALLERYGPPILFVEDRPYVLDLVREEGLTPAEVRTVRVLRPESPYVREKSLYVHETVHAVAVLW